MSIAKPCFKRRFGMTMAQSDLQDLKKPALRLALYQPDIPQNTGTMMRMAACLGVAVDLIEPAGFPTGDRTFRRAGMDYLDAVNLTRHVSYSAFDLWRRERGLRLLLLTTKAEASHLDVRYRPGDILMVGRESAGVPYDVQQAADLRVRVPMLAHLRSLNVAVSAAIVLAEALRQTGGFEAL
jgi:tRNA (cytidine/uridine-2'-O-)-methyltransferase